MNAEKKALLLLGSAKQEGTSTSESLGRFLLQRLAAQGWQTDTVLLHRALRTDERAREMAAAADAADLVVLAFPLYVDTLPYLATRALELIAEDRTSGRDRTDRERQFLALANCGFPEAHHCDVALAICRQFAQEAGFGWAGGLALGAGGAINGQSLEKVGGMARNVIAALDRAAEALARGDALPAEVEALIRTPLMPKRLYLLAGNAGWLMTARKNRVLLRLGARPLEEP
jgi:hypothetical protein